MMAVNSPWRSARTKPTLPDWQSAEDALRTKTARTKLMPVAWLVEGGSGSENEQTNPISRASCRNSLDHSRLRLGCGRIPGAFSGSAPNCRRRRRRACPPMFVGPPFYVSVDGTCVHGGSPADRRQEFPVSDSPGEIGAIDLQAWDLEHVQIDDLAGWGHTGWRRVRLAGSLVESLVALLV
jgi:hypothetical protein